MKHSAFRTWMYTAVFVGLVANRAAAAEITWTGAVDSDFEVSGNWTGKTTPPTNGTSEDTAVFSGDPSGRNQPSLTLATRGIAAVKFTSSGWTLGGTGLELKFGNGPLSSSGAGTNFVAVNLTHTGYPTYMVEEGNTLVLSGAVLGNKLTKRGTGALILTGDSANTTEVYINEGSAWLGKPEGVNATGVHLNIKEAYGDVPAVTWGASQQVPDNRQLKLTGGVADLNDYDEQVNSIVISGGLIRTGEGTLSITRSLDKEGAIQVAESSARTSEISGKLVLNSKNNTALRLDIDDGPSGIDLDISAVISDADFDGKGEGLEMGDYNLAGNGSGTLRLGGTNTYRRATQIHTGRLVVDGAIGDPVLNQNDAVTIDAGATVAGAGTIHANMVVDGAISPGTVDRASGMSEPGTLTIGSASEPCNLTLGTVSTLEIQLDASGHADCLAVNGNLNIEAGAVLALNADKPPTGVYTILTHTGVRGGLFNVSCPENIRVKYGQNRITATIVPMALTILIQ